MKTFLFKQLQATPPLISSTVEKQRHNEECPAKQTKKKVDDVRNIYILIYFVTEPTSCLSPGHCFHQQEGTENGVLF